MVNHPNRSKRYTPGPWSLFNKNRTVAVTAGDGPHNEVVHWSGFDSSHYPKQVVANARLIAAAPELYEAALSLEVAEIAHANCSECDGEIVPELCPKCFPLFDNARVARRLAVAKAKG